MCNSQLLFLSLSYLSFGISDDPLVIHVPDFMCIRFSQKTLETLENNNINIMSYMTSKFVQSANIHGCTELKHQGIVSGLLKKLRRALDSITSKGLLAQRTSHSVRKVTYQPLPERLRLVPRGRFIIRIRLDLLDIGNKVHLERLLDGLSVPKLGSDVHDWEENEGEVVGDEGVSGPVVFEEDRPSAHLKYSLVSINHNLKET